MTLSRAKLFDIGRKDAAVNWREQRRKLYSGFSMLELMVVIIIIAILFLCLASGYISLQKNQRLGNSAQKVFSALHLARSLAIGNNAIYKVWIDNWVSTPPPFETNFENQFVRVCYFPNIQDALAVTTADKFTLNNNDPSKGPVNYGVASTRLDPQTFLGIQSPVGDTGKEAVLSFYPDGTASQSMVFFVTDDTCQLVNWDDPLTPIYPAYDDKNLPFLDITNPTTGVTPFSRQHLALLRQHAFNLDKLGPQKQPYGDGSRLQMIRVLPGGSIKLLSPNLNGKGDRLW